MQLPNLYVTPWQLAVCKLEQTGVPEWAAPSAFLSYSCTPTEYSLVCEAAFVPETVRAERDWACIAVDGVLDFGMVGILSELTQVLAAKSISVFVVSTFDTDYVLVRQPLLAAAQSALTKHGYTFSDSR